MDHRRAANFGMNTIANRIQWTVEGLVSFTITDAARWKSVPRSFI